VQYLYIGTSIAIADFTNTENWEKTNLEQEGRELQMEIGWLDIQTNNNTYVAIRLSQGKTYRIKNKGSNTAAVYFRIDKSSTGQQYAGAVAPVSTTSVGYIDVVTESNFNYIYIYKTITESYSLAIADVQSLEFRVSDLYTSVSELNTSINDVETTLIKSVTVALSGTATSKIILNNPILLSEDGDELELDVYTQSEYASLSFSNSGVSTNSNLAIQLDKTHIGIRATNGTWLFQSVRISTDGNIKLKISFANGNIYTYVNNVLIRTYTGQKDIQIKSFGDGGNGSYGYWSGNIKSLKVNGAELNLIEQNIQNAVITPIYRFLQPSDIEGIDVYPRGILKYDSTNKIFTFYSQIGKTNKYFSFEVKLDQNNSDLVYLKEWRWSGGNLCEYDGTEFTTITATVYDAENEMAMYFKDAIDYTGGIHGDERIDVSTNSFVHFFAEGRKITDIEMQSDFSIICSSFTYMQLSTLHETSHVNGEFVTGHPIVAYHYKRNTFENCASHLENVIKMASEQIVTQYHAGLMCVGKGAGKYAILPGMIVTPELSGSNPPSSSASHHNADDFSASRVDLWNPETGVRCYVEGNMMQGFDNETDIDQFQIWDRSSDSKYYRRYVDINGKVFAANAFIRNVQDVVYR
jgi:hypothetical protein